MEVVYGGAADPGIVRAAMEGVDAVLVMIRATTETSPGGSDQEKWFNCCLKSSANVLDVAKDMDLVQIIAGSMDGVYGIGKVRFAAPITEDDPMVALPFHYGLYKIAEEELYRQYVNAYDLPITITRFPLIYNQIDKVARNWNGFAGWGLVTEEKVIRRGLDKDGQPFISHQVLLPDAVQGVLLALQEPKAIGQTFNFPAPKAQSSQEMAEILQAKCGYPVEDVDTDRHGWQLDWSKAAELLGYQPRYDLAEMVREAEISV